jgi:hypothetical protein
MTDTTPATAGIVTVLNPVRLIYAQLFEAVRFGQTRTSPGTGEPKYSASFVFDKSNPDFNVVKSTAVAVAKAKWPGRDIGADWKAGRFNLPFSTGKELIDAKKAKLAEGKKEYDGRMDFLADTFVLKSSSKFPARFAVIENGVITPDLDGTALVANKSKFYNGVKCLVQVNLVAYDKVGKTGVDGVTCYLNIINSLNEGERISGGQTAAEAFSQYAGKPSSENPMDDDIPF